MRKRVFIPKPWGDEKPANNYARDAVRSGHGGAGTRLSLSGWGTEVWSRNSVGQDGVLKCGNQTLSVRMRQDCAVTNLRVKTKYA